LASGHAMTKMHQLVFWNTVNFVGFSVIHVSQSSVATYVRCGGMSTQRCICIANFQLILVVKEFLKSVKIWQSYCQKFCGFLFFGTVYSCHFVCSRQVLEIILWSGLFLGIAKTIILQAWTASLLGTCSELKSCAEMSCAESRAARVIVIDTTCLCWTYFSRYSEGLRVFRVPLSWLCKSSGFHARNKELRTGGKLATHWLA